MVAFQKNLEKRLKDLSAEAKKNDLLTFKQFGVDFMFVDEDSQDKSTVNREVMCYDIKR